MRTDAAKAAALLRKEIKEAFPGLKFRCTSEVYSGGSSVRVSYQDQPPAVHQTIKAIAAKYQYGSFDGMQDLYEYNNVLDIPQAKYVFVDNTMSDDLREHYYQRLRAEWSGGCDLPETYNEGRNMPFQGCWVSQIVWRHFCEGR